VRASDVLQRNIPLEALSTHSLFTLPAVARFKKPVLNTDQKQRLKQLYERDNYHGMLAILANLLWIGVAISIALLSNYWAYALSALLIGARQRALASLLHEAAHSTLFKSRWLNLSLGRVLCGWTILQTFGSYRTSHVLNHHPKIGAAALDPDFSYMEEAGVYRAQTRLQFILRYLCAPLLGMLTPRYIMFLLRHRFIDAWRDPQGRLEILALSALHLAALGIAWAGGVLLQYMSFWWLPFLTVYPVIGWFSELAEHYPMMEDAPGKAVFYSRNRYASRVEKIFIGMHADYLHLTHHLFPGIPHWNLAKANEILREDEEYRAWDDIWGGIFSAATPARISFVKYILNHRQFPEQLACPVFQQEG
jgi:fatty acid desaturase